MKKLFLTLVIAFAGIFSANAQVWMGGSVNFNRLKENKDADAAFTYGIAPEIGYTIAPKWDIALALGYQGAYAKNASVLLKLRILTNSQLKKLEMITKKLKMITNSMLSP